MNGILRLAACLALTMSTAALAEGDAEAGKAKAVTCAACHGMDGNSTVAMWPKIAGQHGDYHKRHITLIRDGDRPVPEMQALVASLSDQDIADLAAFYASQTTSPGAADENLAAAGERVTVRLEEHIAASGRQDGFMLMVESPELEGAKGELLRRSF